MDNHEGQEACLKPVQPVGWPTCDAEQGENANSTPDSLVQRRIGIDASLQRIECHAREAPKARPVHHGSCTKM
jgi:hypothetical protein